MTEQPPQNPYGAPQYGGYQPPRDHPQATTILVVGILALVLCQLAGPFAWVMGGKARKEIQASNGQIGGLQQVTIGWILGIVSTALLILGVVVAVVFFGLVVTTATTTGY
ncbi:DUF4190 domain-containing protein [Nocardioides sp.]|uniref:DUF4190 domain-containing protein n=1 Tax=Nocardioides sp. TaxID=35761 RepID=UPI002B267503|nr:DUF4190 domain-containing protein [Nocardioides sp.]